MEFLVQVEKAKDVMSFLAQEGASKVLLVKAKDIVVDDRVRFQCSQSGCYDYGKPIFPPNVSTVNEFRNVLREYTMGIILQLNSPIHMDSWKSEADKHALDLHNLVYRGEKKAFSLGFPLAAGLIGGSCKICDNCRGTTKNECTNKDKARPSMEAMGIDVIKTCKNAGLDIEFVKGEVTWTALILLD